MSREVDTREVGVADVGPERRAQALQQLREVSDRLPGDHRLDIMGWDAASGNPATIRSTQAPAEAGDTIARAMRYAEAISPVLGLEGGSHGFAPHPAVRTTSSGAAVVHLQEQHLGIPVFQGTLTVRFDPDGAVGGTVGTVHTIPQGSAATPTISSATAVAAAADHLANAAPGSYGEAGAAPAVDVSDFRPAQIAAITMASDRPAVFDRGPFDAPLTARLMWFPQSRAVVCLAWEVYLTMPGGFERYRCLVDAADAGILYCRQVIMSASAQGNVFRTSPSASRTAEAFPAALATYPVAPARSLPSGFPDDWVTAQATEGNNARATVGDGAPLAGVIASDRLFFAPADDMGDEQKVLNAFYLICVMHDYFYLLGFREEDDNYQEDKLGRGGHGGDAVNVKITNTFVTGTATFAPSLPGTRPTCTVGPADIQPDSRHSALDASVVFHEYTHGVSTRLVGGGLDLETLAETQSKGMGEGWSDYTACTVLNIEVVGAWLEDNVNGIRSHPYDESYPNHFDKLADEGFKEEHDIGEIWCATLLQMTRNIGHGLAVQLVIDGMKLTPANPGFLEGRDALFKALDDRLQGQAMTEQEHDQAQQGMWQAFAGFGMGPAATAIGARAGGVVADFHAPLPQVSGVDPGTGEPVGGTTVTIGGKWFTGAREVRFGTALADNMMVVSDSEITVIAPSGQGTVDVTVTTPAGVSATFSAAQFTYVAAGQSGPTVTGVDPSSGDPLGGTVVTITGSGLMGATDVGFGATSVADLAVGDDTRITVKAPQGSPGTVDVRVTTAAGTSAASDAARFTYDSATPAALVVTAIDPSSGDAGGGTLVTIRGSGLSTATDVVFGVTSVADLTRVSDTEMTVLSPSGVGVVEVRVSSAKEASPSSDADSFTYLAMPVVAGVDPGSGDPAGGTMVTISGSGLTGASAVRFGDTPAASLARDSDIQITAVSPPGEGTVAVKVTTPAGTNDPSAAAEFTYVAAAQSVATVTGVDPSSGDPLGGTVVTITGSGLMGATDVGFGVTSVADLVVGDDTRITVKAPQGSPGTVDVQVTTAAGTSATSDVARFTYESAAPAPLAVSGIDPSSGDAGGGTLVTIRGSGLSAVTDVVFDMASASELTVIDDAAITVLSPPGAGRVAVAVRTAETASTSEFTYQSPDPGPADPPVSDPPVSDPPPGDQSSPGPADPVPSDPPGG